MTCLCNKRIELKSACCGADVSVNGDKEQFESACFYTCDTCKKPCDAKANEMKRAGEKCSACENNKSCPCTCEQCKSPTPHATDWETRWNDLVDDRTTTKTQMREFIRTTVDEVVREERGRTAKGIIKQIENLDLTGVNQVISLIHQIDKWMPPSAK